MYIAELVVIYIIMYREYRGYEVALSRNSHVGTYNFQKDKMKGPIVYLSSIRICRVRLT